MKLNLTTLLLFSTISIAQNNHVEDIYNGLKTLDNELSNIQFQGARINLKEKSITYPLSKSKFLFYIRDDHNGKPLYLLEYAFPFEDVQTNLKKLQRITWGRTNKKTKDYRKKS